MVKDTQIDINPENPHYSPWDDFLEGTPNLSNIGKGLGGGLLGAVTATAAIGAFPEIARRTGLSKAFQMGAMGMHRMSTKIDDFYTPGADKVTKVMEHIGLKGKSDEIRQIQWLLKKAKGDIELANQPLTPKGRLASSTKIMPHSRGFASQVLSEIEQTGLKSAERNIAWQEGLTGPEEYLREKINPKDMKQIKRIQKAIHTGKTPYKTAAEARRAIELGIKQEVGYGTSQAGRLLRHEAAAQELIAHVNDAPVNYDRLRQAGIRKPVYTQAEKAFGRHSSAMKAWGLNPGKNVTHSTIARGYGDSRILIGAAKRDMQYKLGEFVYKYADIYDPKSVEKVAADYASRWSVKNSNRAFRVHPNTSAKEELSRFLKNYKIKNGQLHINYSPHYKPHFLLGGTNANAIFSRGAKGALKHDVLVSDLYDLFDSDRNILPQRRTHVTTAHSSSDALYKGAYKETLKSSRTNPQRLIQAVKNKDIESIVKYAKSTAKRTGQKLKGMAYYKNPIIRALTKGGPKGKALAAALLLAGGSAGALYATDEE